MLNGDSDEAECVSKGADPSSSFDAKSQSRPAKRQRHESSTSRVSDTLNTVDLSEGISHVSDTVREPTATEAPVQPASAANDDAESPTLSPQQVRIRCRFADLLTPRCLWCSHFVTTFCRSKKWNIL